MTGGAKIRCAVIGAGWWGAATHIPTLAARADVVLDGVCRLGAEELERVRSHFGFAFASDDYRDLLARMPDVAIVASPHHLHYRQAADAIEAGAHVLVEKPMTLDPAEAWDLVRRAEAKGVHLLLCNAYQYMPGLDEIRAMLRDGTAVGAVESVFCSFVSVTRSVFSGGEGLTRWKTTFFRPDRATWQDPAQGGGFAYGQMSHAIPLTLWLTGLTPRRVAAYVVAAEGVDLCDAATVTFEGGAIGTFHGAAAMPEGSRALMRITVTGSEGVVILDIDRDHGEIRRHDGATRVFAMPQGAWIPDGRTPTDAVVDLALGRGENRSPGPVGAATVGVIAAMLQSQGRDVAVFESGGPAMNETAPETETYAFALKLRPGKEAEYKARHDAIWPEMQAMLLGSGILAYEIYLDRTTNTLFAHIVRRVDHTMPANRTNLVMLRWRAHMADVLEMDGDEAVRHPLERMFMLTG